jgi:hypothetical protein
MTTGKWKMATYYTTAGVFDCDMCGCEKLPCTIFVKNIYGWDTTEAPPTIEAILPGMVMLRICEHCGPTIGSKLQNGEAGARFQAVGRRLSTIIQENMERIKGEVESETLIQIGQSNERNGDGDGENINLPPDIEGFLRSLFRQEQSND